MKERFDTRRAAAARLGTLAPISSALALALGAVARAQDAQLVREADLGELRRPSAVRPALPEAPPEHPVAAPCTGCGGAGCGAGPRGIPNVYLHSGELHLREVDLVVPGRGLDFEWVRTYRSRLGSDTPQGHGWTSSYDVSIAMVGTEVAVMDGSGRTDLYERLPDGVTYAANQFFREGQFLPDGSFELRFSDGGTWTFFRLDGTPIAGKLSTITDRNGNQLGFDYDGLGRLELIVDTLGRQYEVAYDGNGRIASLTDFLGRQVVYQYYSNGDAGGGAGDLKSARSPIVTGTPNGNDFPAGKTKTYTYSKGFADERLNHNLLTVTDPKGQTWMQNEYAGQQHPGQLSFDRVVRTTRGNTGESFEISYDETVGPTLLVIVNDPVGNVSQFDYDELGRCVRQRDFTGRANPVLPTTRTSNRPMNPLRASDPAFFETAWQYNVDSRPTRIVHPNGNVAEMVYEYDLDPLAAPRSRGNLRRRTKLPGSHVPAGDQASLIETFEYDAELGGCCGSNFVKKHVDARGHTTEHVYDTKGNRLQTTHRIPSIREFFTYNAFGQMTSHTHPDNGKGWRQIDAWTYYGPADGHQNGYLRTEVIDATGFGLMTSWTYDAAGNAIFVTDARGSTTTMVVNQLNQVVRQTSPPVQTMGGPAVQYEVDTFFDANDNVVRVDTKNFDDQGNLSSNPYLTSTWEHDILNRIVRETEEVDAAADVVTEYEYDANRNRTLTRYGEATNGSQPTNVERYVYDERNLLFQRIRAEGDPMESTSQMDYDPNGNRVMAARGLENPTPRVETWTFDGYGRAVQQTDPMGNVTLREFDPNGNVTHLLIEGEICDVPGSAGNVRLFEADWVYDAMDRRTRTFVQHFDTTTQLPIGDGVAQTVWGWSDRSMETTVTDDNGNTTTLCYDTAGRKEALIDAKGNRTEWLYDANGNVTTQVEREKSDGGFPDQVFTTTFAYDVLDRETLKEDSLGNEVATGYDSRDNVTRTVDTKGNVSISEFDGMDRLVMATRILTDDGTGGGTPVGAIARTWAWDDSGRLVGQTDDAGNTTVYEYDALSRQVRTVFADGKQEIRAYDASDNCVATFDPNGTLVLSDHDLCNRISGRTIAPATNVSTDTTFEVWKHDGLSRLVHAEDDDSLVTKTWDSMSNQVTETQNGQTFVCTHDGMRNELSLTYPSGPVVTSTYDALNRLKSTSSGGHLATYDYVGPARVEARTGGASRRTTYGYDGARRVTSILHRLNGVPIDSRSYEWDAMYNRTKSTNLLTAGFDDFTYDSQYRLTRSVETGPSGGVVSDVQVDFDGVGNRTMVTGGACAGAYTMDATPREPADQQMNQYTNTPCIGCIEYDRNGNQVARGGAEAMVYDYRNRMTLHMGPGGTTAFAYDALGRNIAKVGATPAQTVGYLYHGLDVVEERDGNGVVQHTIFRGRQSMGPVTKLSHLSFNPQPEPPPHAREILAVDNGSRLHFWADDLNSTRVVTDASGVVERYEYDDAGMPSVFDASGTALPMSAIGNSWLFTGQRWDTETSFYAYYGRSMDPLLGQFLSRDPVGIWTDPVNLGNGRTYVGNNFQTLVDPTGMYSKACGGPWPGPKTVYYGYVDCGSNFTIPDALCRAMRGAGRAKRAADKWVNYSLFGYPGNWSWLIAIPFHEWFAGPNGVISHYWRFVIQDKIRRVWNPFKYGHQIGIECEGSCDTNVNAYVAWYDSNIHLCPKWWDASANRRGSILLHELSHDKADTDDNFYYFSQTKASTFNLGGIEVPNVFETGTLADNADTYEGLFLKYYIR